MARARVGQTVLLDLRHVGRGAMRLEGVVRRVHRSAHGWLLGCSFEGDASASVAAWRLSRQLAQGDAAFMFPTLERRRGFVLGDHFGLRTVALVAVGAALLLLGAVITWGYFSLA